MTSKKTTISGVVSFAVAVLSPLAAYLVSNKDYALYGLMLAAAINSVGNMFSRDNDASDQDVGLRPEISKPDGLDPASK